MRLNRIISKDSCITILAFVSFCVQNPYARAGGDAKLPVDLALVPPGSLGFVRVQLDDIWADLNVRTLIVEALSDGRDFAETVGFDLADVRTVTFIGTTPTMDFRELPGLFVISTRDALNKKSVEERLLKRTNRDTYKGREIFLENVGSPRSPVYMFIDERTFLFGMLSQFKQLIDAQDVKGEHSGLLDALNMARQKRFLTAGLQIPDGLANALQGESLPPQLRMFTPLIHVRSVTARVDLGDEVAIDATLEFPDEARAEAGLAVARTALALAQLGMGSFVGQLEGEESKSLLHLLKAAQRGLLRADFKQDRRKVHIAARIEVNLPTLAQGFGEFTKLTIGSAARIRDANNLRQIVTALHHIASTMDGVFPPHAIYGKDGRPLLSWRVRILPYIEQDALYREFHLDEPWDSPHNKKLLKKMPPLYASPTTNTDPPYTTRYQIFTGKGTMFIGPTTLPLSRVTNMDGVSSTILLAESGKPVLWTKPEDMEYDARKPLPKLGGTMKDGFNIGMGDGAIRFLKYGVDKKTLRNLITADDGQSIDFEKLK